MDKRKQPGIAIEAICLERAAIAVNPTDAPASDKLSYNLQITEFVRTESPDGKSRLVQCSFDLMHGIKNPPLDFTCTFLASYAAIGDYANMSWGEFSDVMATAHIIPFLREFIANMTNRMPFPPLLIDPINVSVLLRHYHSRKAKAAPVTAEGQ